MDKSNEATKIITEAFNKLKNEDERIKEVEKFRKKSAAKKSEEEEQVIRKARESKVKEREAKQRAARRAYVEYSKPPPPGTVETKWRKGNEETKHPRSIPENGSYKSGVLWEKSEHFSTCAICGEEFGIRRWKHHCRKCGQLVCDNCSKHESPIWYEKNNVRSHYRHNEKINVQEFARTCDNCWKEFSEIEKEKYRSREKMSEKDFL